MRSLTKIACGLALSLAFASPAFAEKCKFGPQEGPLAHDRDDADPPLKCKKCEEIASDITKNDANVWTLDLKYGHPKRCEIKKETGTSEVYWYLYYEVTNNDKLERPCFIDVTAETDKGKRRFTYHDSMIPEVKEELAKRVGVKKGEILYTSEELRHPAQATNELPNKDNPESGKPEPGKAILPKIERNKDSGTYEGASAKLAFLMIKPGETKRCVAVFQKLDTEFDFLTIYFYGLCNTTTSTMKTQMPDLREPFAPGKKVEMPDSLNPEASPVGGVPEAEYRLVNDGKIQEIEANKRKVIERVFAIEYSCLGDEFAKTSRSTIKNEEQLLRPKNQERDETKPPAYKDAGHFGTEIVEAEDPTLEGKKVLPYNFLGRKWIQTEKVIKSDLR